MGSSGRLIWENGAQRRGWTQSRNELVARGGRLVGGPDCFMMVVVWERQEQRWDRMAGWA